MPTDRQPTEQEMAREALGLLRAHATGGWIKTASGLRLPDNAALCFFRAKHIHERYGSCPGFWGEVLAAVRVLGGDAPFEPAAILAALRAVVGAVDA